MDKIDLATIEEKFAYVPLSREHLTSLASPEHQTDLASPSQTRMDVVSCCVFFPCCTHRNTLTAWQTWITTSSRDDPIVSRGFTRFTLISGVTVIP